MSLKGIAMTDKVLRGKIKDIHQIEDVEALFAEAEELLAEAERIFALAQGSSPSRIAYIELLSANWVGDKSPYSQVVTVEGATNKSQVDLTPSVEQLSAFYSKDLTFVTKNNNGEITVYAIGQKPMNDYTIQATVTEVIV